MHTDTIVAPITGSQPAAVAIVRLSGPESWQIGSQVFTPWPAEPVSHHATFGRIRTGDEALALPFADGHSYTGEESLELSIHGSPASVKALVEECRREGARMAGPGEFTQRAFMNGRMDLSQAEGVRDTVMAQTDAQLRQANLHRDGALRQEVQEMADEAMQLLTSVEASVDFSEEIGDLDRDHALQVLEDLRTKAETLLATAAAGRIMRYGLRIAIIGPPNAGKSSLLNVLLGVNRAIVSDVPGTTRDYLEEQADLGGVLCVLFDTAGLRERPGHVESIGIQLARAIASNADEIWYIYDASLGWEPSDDAALAHFDRSVLVLANKSDLPPAASTKHGSLAISAITRAGLPSLIEHVQSKLTRADERPFINERHRVALEAAILGLTSAVDAIKHDLPDDLVSVGLRETIVRLGEITGETATPDIIERIFHDFCIGK